MALRDRLIPILLIEDERLIKTKKFHSPRYLGDPLNALRIFNEKCADEILIIDKSSKHEPNFKLLERMVSEAFMPLSYVGNINSFQHFEKVFSLGIEKVGSKSLIYKDPNLINDASKRWGKSSIFLVVDFVIEDHIFFDYSQYNKSPKLLIDRLKHLQELSFGELIIQNVTNEGSMTGLNENAISIVKEHIKVPIIASGGAKSIKESLDFIRKMNISGVSAGSMFSFYGNRQAVLITYDYI